MERPLIWIVPLVSVALAVPVGITASWTATGWAQAIFGLVGGNFLFQAAEGYRDLRRFLRNAASVKGRVVRLEERTVCGANGDGVNVQVPVIAYRHGVREYEIDGPDSKSAVGDPVLVRYLEASPREGRAGTTNDLCENLLIEAGVGVVSLIALTLIAGGFISI